MEYDLEAGVTMPVQIGDSGYVPPPTPPLVDASGKLTPYGEKLVKWLKSYFDEIADKGAFDKENFRSDADNFYYHNVIARRIVTPAQFLMTQPQMASKLWDTYFTKLDQDERSRLEYEILSRYGLAKTGATDALGAPEYERINPPMNSNTNQESAVLKRGRLMSLMEGMAADQKALDRATVHLREGLQELEREWNAAIPPRAYESAEDWLKRMKKLDDEQHER